MPLTRDLDAADRVLVAALLENARVTYAELGRAVGMSAPAAHERVRRLEEAGIIRGYHAEVDLAAVGLPVSALVGIIQTDSSEQEEVAQALRSVTAVQDCWLVAGEESFVVHVRVADVDALERALGALRRVPGVARTRTTVVLSTRWEGRLPDLTAVQIEPAVER